MITFTSYSAPVLEEAYDYYYFTSYENISGSGQYSFYDTDGVTEIFLDGLGVTPYFMWNAAENPSTVFYGATFVDYIGHYDADLIMVRPVNGRNYETFVMGQYFTLTIDGASAADDVTQAAIDAINALPDTVSLSDKAAVEAARTAYDLISTTEQKALVTNYSKLTQAEKRVADLEYLQNQQIPTEPTEGPSGNDGPGAGIAIAVILFLGAAAFITVQVMGRKKKAKNSESNSGEADADKEKMTGENDR